VKTKREEKKKKEKGRERPPSRYAQSVSALVTPTATPGKWRHGKEEGKWREKRKKEEKEYTTRGKSASPLPTPACPWSPCRAGRVTHEERGKTMKKKKGGRGEKYRAQSP